MLKCYVYYLREDRDYLEYYKLDFMVESRNVDGLCDML